MKKSLTKRPAPILGSIHRDEVLPVREVARRLGWNRASIVRAQRNGLKVVRCGQFTLTTGQAVFDYIEAMMKRQAERGSP